jgi:hypothetical protein
MHGLWPQQIIQPGALHHFGGYPQATSLRGFLHGGMLGFCYQQAFAHTLRVGERCPHGMGTKQP